MIRLSGRRYKIKWKERYSRGSREEREKWSTGGQRQAERDRVERERTLLFAFGVGKKQTCGGLIRVVAGGGDLSVGEGRRRGGGGEGYLIQLPQRVENEPTLDKACLQT